MTTRQLLAIFLLSLCLITMVMCSCKPDPRLTVEDANAYIAENKNGVNLTYRQKYHAMSPIGWMSEPSAFIFFQDEYHLFYRHNPYDTDASYFHWGHIKSKDLVHWENLPTALAPDQIYDRKGVWSGSAIEKDGKLYVMYTGFTGRKQVQCIAVSEDGIRFEKIKQNPVLHKKDLPPNAQPEEFRDPKVLKHDDTYYAVIGSKTDDETGQVLLYQSDDLIVWQYKSVLLEGTKDQGEMWLSPDLFELDGKDVLLITAKRMPRSGNDYSNLNSVIKFIGKVDWDRGVFTMETMKEIDHGMDFHAAKTTSDNRGRRIMTAWMNMWGRDNPTADLGRVGGMILPRELSIKDEILVQDSITEITYYCGKVIDRNDVDITDEFYQRYNLAGDVIVLEIEVNLKQAVSFAIGLRADDYLDEGKHTLITYNVSSYEVTLDRSNNGITINGEENPQVTSRSVVTPLIDDMLKLKICVDTSSIEIFVNDGIESLTATIYPPPEHSSGIYFDVVGRAKFKKLILNQLRLR